MCQVMLRKKFLNIAEVKLNYQKRKYNLCDYPSHQQAGKKGYHLSDFFGLENADQRKSDKNALPVIN